MSSLTRADAEAVLRAVPELERLRNRRLLLTGGTGFLGCWLLETLAALNDAGDPPCRVYLPTRDIPAFAARAPHLAARPEFVTMPGDVASFAYPDEGCDYVIHAAAPASPLVAPLAAGETIVTGTRHVLDLAVRHSANRVLFVSSGAVYGKQSPNVERMSEEYPGAPDLRDTRATYGEAKRYAELLCLNAQAAHGLHVTIARPFTFAGAYQSLDAGFAVTDLVRDALAGGPLRIRGDGTTIRSYCSGADLAHALWAILLRGQPARAYNVGSDAPIAIADLAREVVRAVGRPLAVECARQPEPGALPDRYVPDTSRLADELGVRPHFSLQHALAQLIAWSAEKGATPCVTR